MSLNGRRVGVLMGGRSSEREISLKSGSAVSEALRSAGVNVFPLDVAQETEEGIRELLSRNPIDLAFVAMHGGFGEGGDLQFILEKMGVPFTGPTQASSRLAMDKIASRRLFRKAGLRVPRTRIFRRNSPMWTLGFLRYPLVVKPSAQGSSIGISFVESKQQLAGALREALKYGPRVLVEEFIRGREITVAVLDGAPLPVVEIVPKKRFFDYQAKYEKGQTEYQVPASLSGDVARRAQEDAVAAYRALGCRHLSRVDMILKDGKIPYILEVNTIPGMTAMSLFPKAAEAAGISFDRLCVRLLELAWRNNA